jgi:hypothetical protein
MYFNIGHVLRSLRRSANEWPCGAVERVLSGACQGEFADVDAEIDAFTRAGEGQ